MDLKHFDSLAALAADHRKHLEDRLKRARSNRKNLERMVEETIANINQRAEQDKESVSELFTHLIANEEATIIQIREELGEERKLLKAEAKGHANGQSNGQFMPPEDDVAMTQLLSSMQPNKKPFRRRTT